MDHIAMTKKPNDIFKMVTKKMPHTSNPWIKLQLLQLIWCVSNCLSHALMYTMRFKCCLFKPQDKILLFDILYNPY